MSHCRTEEIGAFILKTIQPYFQLPVRPQFLGHPGLSRTGASARSLWALTSCPGVTHGNVGKANEFQKYWAQHGLRSAQVSWLREQHRISSPTFLSFYTLVFCLASKFTLSQAGLGSHMGVFLLGMGHHRAFQTAALRVEVLAWLSFPEPANLQNLDVRGVTPASAEH